MDSAESGNHPPRAAKMRTMRALDGESIPDAYFRRRSMVTMLRLIRSEYRRNEAIY